MFVFALKTDLELFHSYARTQIHQAVHHIIRATFRELAVKQKIH